MRTKRLDRPGSWRAWDGDGFNVQLREPLPRQRLARTRHVCEPVAHGRDRHMSQSLTYNTYLGKCMLVSTRGPTVRGGAGRVRHLLLALRRPDPLGAAQADPRGGAAPDLRVRRPQPDPLPVACSTRAASRATSRRPAGRPYLYFTRFHYSNCELDLNRDLVRVKVRFSK